MGKNTTHLGSEIETMVNGYPVILFYLWFPLFERKWSGVPKNDLETRKCPAF